MPSRRPPRSRLDLRGPLAPRHTYEVIGAVVADEPGAGSLHTCASTPATTEWTHLAGGYDGTGLVLYVDGVLAASHAIPAPTWNATGDFALGRALCHADACRLLTGSLARAEVWDRALDPRELRDGLFGDPPVIRPFSAAGWSFDVSCCGVVDDALFGHDLTLAPTATLEEFGPGYALHGTARTTGPVLRTDGSFTVSSLVWSQTPTTGTVLSVDGTDRSALELGRDAVSGNWCATMALADDVSAGTVSACAADPGTDFLFLAVVYDAGADVLTLYVNETPAASVAVPVPMWNATGAFVLGRSTGGFDGLIATVRPFTGTLTQAQIAALD